jgi:hypothetical protein
LLLFSGRLWGALALGLGRLDRDANPSICGVTTRQIQFVLLAYSDVFPVHLIGLLEILDREYRISRDSRSNELEGSGAIPRLDDGANPRPGQSAGRIGIGTGRPGGREGGGPSGAQA